MNLPRFALTHKTVVLSFLMVAMTIGLYNAAAMPRRARPSEPEKIISSVFLPRRLP